MHRTEADERREAEALEEGDRLVRVELATSTPSGWRWAGWIRWVRGWLG